MNISPKSKSKAKPKSAPKKTVKIPISIYEVEVEVPELPTISMLKIDMQKGLATVMKTTGAATVAVLIQARWQSS